MCPCGHQESDRHPCPEAPFRNLRLHLTTVMGFYAAVFHKPLNDSVPRQPRMGAADSADSRRCRGSSPSKMTPRMWHKASSTGCLHLAANPEWVLASRTAKTAGTTGAELGAARTLLR